MKTTEREIKFTTDGKKVVVIGSLNSTEKIVQEIFIVDGSEIPSGEHFVVKSLHDAPAVSWKEKSLKDLEERYDRERNSILKSLDELQSSYRKKSALFKEKIQWMGDALKNADPNAFNLLVDYITGNITHIVIGQWEPEIKTLETFNEMYENKLRLISFFGNTEGKFDYAQGQYYDYSGSNTRFYPCRSMNEAVEKLKEIILKEKLTEGRIKTAKMYGIELPDEMLKEFKERAMGQYKKSIEQSQNEIDRQKQNILNLSTL